MSYDFSTWDRNSDVEQTEPLYGSLTGSIPTWLSGSFICNGPGLMKYGEQEFKHVFDGSAILQKFSFTETGVTYTSKFIKSFAYLSNSEQKRIVVSEFGTNGTTLSKGTFARLGEKFQFERLFSDNTPVTLAQFGGSYYATTEAPFLHKIDPVTLDTLEKIDLHKILGVSSACSHPVLLDDGSTVNVLIGMGMFGPKYDVVKFPPEPPAGKADVFEKPIKLASCYTRWKLNQCHMHTFGLSGKYVVLPEQPLTIDVTAMVANIIKENSIIESMDWLENTQVVFRVLSLETGKELKHKLKCDPFFYMHIVNCYEDGEHIVIDMITYSSPSVMHQFKIDNIRTNASSIASEVGIGCVRRLVIPLQCSDKATPDEDLVNLPSTKASAHRQKDGTVLLTSQIISDVAFENPVINPKFERRPYQYFYGVSGKMTENKSVIGKVDICNSSSQTDEGESDRYASSVVFVPRPGAQAEDDGVLLVHTLHSDKLRVTFVVLDAATMTEIAKVAFQLSCNASRSLHAVYVP